MSIVTEMPDSDSGVASPETAPDDLLLMNKKLDSTTDNNKTSKVSIFQPASKGSSAKDDEDAEDYDETLAERLLGLTEMFPDSLRSASVAVSKGTVSLIKGTYKLSRQIVWISVTTSLILFAPVMFELDRFNSEEAAKQDRNRLVLGPGSAMSGTGMVPVR